MPSLSYQSFFFGILIFLLSENLVAQQHELLPTSAIDSTLETKPEFKKGSLESFFRKNLEYPEDAKERKVEGKVLVGFVVDAKGKVKSPKILQSLGYGCDEEALDLIGETSGDWSPGTRGGKKVDMAMQIPVVFRFSFPKNP